MKAVMRKKTIIAADCNLWFNNELTVPHDETSNYWKLPQLDQRSRWSTSGDIGYHNECDRLVDKSS